MASALSSLCVCLPRSISSLLLNFKFRCLFCDPVTNGYLVLAPVFLLLLLLLLLLLQLLLLLLLLAAVTVAVVVVLLVVVQVPGARPYV